MYSYIYKMANLKIYQKEREEFPYTFERYMTEEKAEKMLRQLLKTYKVDLSHYANSDGFVVRFKKQNGASFEWTNTTIKRFTFNFPKDKVCYAFVIHEFAHALDFSRRQNTKHDKKFYKMLLSAHRYCKNKDYVNKYCLSERKS